MKKRSVKQCWIDTYGEIEGLKKWEERNKKCRIKIIDKFIKEYGEIEGRLKYDIWNKERSNRSLSSFIKRYGEIEGKIKYDNFKEKDRKKGTLEGFIERYGEIDGPTKYYQKNKKLSVSKEALKENGFSEEEIIEIRNIHSIKSAHTLENFIERYGETEGNKKYKEWKNSSKERTNLNVNFYLKKGFSLEEAKMIIGNLQKRDLNFFIEKYGEIEGLKKYNDCNKKRNEAKTLEGFINKYGVEEGIIKYKIKNSKISYGQTLNFYIDKYGKELGEEKYKNFLIKKIKARQNQLEIISSKFEKDVYDFVFIYLKDKIYSNFTKPFYINISENDKIKINSKLLNKIIIPDIKYKNLIIECDGFYWHSINNQKERDIEKNKLYNLLGFSVFRVCEKDWINKKDEIKNKIILFINNNLNNNFEYVNKGERDENKIN